MPDLTTIGLFALAAFVLSLMPGPDMLYIATRAVTQGRGAGVASVLGVYTGTLVHTAAAALGLTALIAASAAAFSVVKYAGAAYLLYLGVYTLLSRAPSLKVRNEEPAKLRAIFYQGLLVNLLNPKVILFFLAFLPQFLHPERGNVTVQLVVLGIVLIIVTFPVNLAVGLAGGWLGARLQAKRGVERASKWIAGSVYIVLGLATALTGTRRS